jgi:hypothetical protein
LKSIRGQIDWNGGEGSFMYGVVRHLQDRPMIDVIDSDDVQISQRTAFEPADFPHLSETIFSIPSFRACSLSVRDDNDSQGDGRMKSTNSKPSSRASLS